MSEFVRRVCLAEVVITELQRTLARLAAARRKALSYLCVLLHGSSAACGHRGLDRGCRLPVVRRWAAHTCVVLALRQSRLRPPGSRTMFSVGSRSACETLLRRHVARCRAKAPAEPDGKCRVRLSYSCLCAGPANSLGSVCGVLSDGARCSNSLNWPCLGCKVWAGLRRD